MVAGSLVLAGVAASKVVSPKFAYLAGAIGNVPDLFPRDTGAPPEKGN